MCGESHRKAAQNAPRRRAKVDGKTARLPKVKLDFARRSFYFLGASIFNSLPLSLRNINSRVLFRNALDDYYL